MPSDETDEITYDSSGTETNDDDDGNPCFISQKKFIKYRIIAFQQKFESLRKKYTMELLGIGQIVLVVFSNNREPS